MGWPEWIRPWGHGRGGGALCYVFIGCQERSDRWPRVHAMMEARGAPYRIVYAGPEPIAPAHQNEVYLERCRDSYEALPEKIVATCRYLQSLPFAMFAKLDDDMLVLHDPPPAPRTGDYLGTVFDASTPDRRWHQGKCSPGSAWNDRVYEGDYVPWCSGGAGYLLSRRAVEIIARIDTTDLAEVEIYEDVMVARTLLREGISPLPLEPGHFVPIQQLGSA